MSENARAGYAGTGPGEITPDGCAVDLYARLPVGTEPQVVARAVPPPASLLELGCGAGRVTRSLAALGYDVTAVDESAAMLARVDGARTVHSPIETLDLPGTFDVVLLASFLVHGRTAAEMLRVCRRHVAPGGRVLVQREGPGWHEEVPRERPVAGGVARVVADEDAGDGFRAVHVEYEFPDAFWTQTFLSRPLTTEQFERLLADAGLTVDRYLTPDGSWVLASPAG
jgi:SAM-dependent methyltransferase